MAAPRGGRDDERLNASNARQGIKTKLMILITTSFVFSLNASNARQGIKTHTPLGDVNIGLVSLNASNARQGIKTIARGTLQSACAASERLQCPTGH